MTDTKWTVLTKNLLKLLRGTHFRLGVTEGLAGEGTSAEGSKEKPRDRQQHSWQGEHQQEGARQGPTAEKPLRPTHRTSVSSDAGSDTSGHSMNSFKHHGLPLQLHANKHRSYF